MIPIIVMVALAIFSTWWAYRGWRKGVITVRSVTSRRDDDEWGFNFDLGFTCLFAALCWIGAAICIYKQINSN